MKKTHVQDVSKEQNDLAIRGEVVCALRNSLNSESTMRFAIFYECPRDFRRLLSGMKVEGYKKLSCNQWYSVSMKVYMDNTSLYTSATMSPVYESIWL